MRHLGLIVATSSAFAAVAAPLAVMVAVIAIGVIKIGVGMTRDRPVGLLVTMCVLDAVLALALFGRPAHRTRGGDAVLRRLRRAADPLRTSARTRSAHLASDDVARAVALFGVAELSSADPQLRALAAMMQPAGGGGGDGGSSCGGSSCGGSSCGGGGGCGGCGGG